MRAPKRGDIGQVYTRPIMLYSCVVVAVNAIDPVDTTVDTVDFETIVNMRISMLLVQPCLRIGFINLSNNHFGPFR